MQSSYQQAVLCFSYLRKSRGETGLVLYCFDFPYFSPLLFVFIVDLGVVIFFFFTVSSKRMGLCTGIKHCLPERFISSLFPCFFVYSIEGCFCYKSRSFSIPPSASFNFSFQVARLTNTYSRTIFSLSSWCQYKGLWANFPSPDFLGLFLVLFPAAIAGLPERLKAVWAISFKQMRNVYHNCSPFTTTMCACAWFTVVVFPRGLWYGFIGCSRCPFGCKYLSIRKCIYTHSRKCLCIFYLL